MFYKFEGKARYGIGYKGSPGGFEMVIQVPLFLWFRKRYEHFETREIRSGKAAFCIQWYLRRRDNEVFQEIMKHGDGPRWLTQWPKFGLTSIGKQKTIVSWKSRRETA